MGSAKPAGATRNRASRCEVIPPVSQGINRERRHCGACPAAFEEDLGRLQRLPPEPANLAIHLNREVNTVLADPTFVERHLTSVSAEPVGGTPAQFTTMLAAELAKCKKIIQDRKITLD